MFRVLVYVLECQRLLPELVGLFGIARWTLWNISVKHEIHEDDVKASFYIL